MPELGTRRRIFIPNECISDHVPLFENYAPDINIPVRYSMDQTISPRARNGIEASVVWNSGPLSLSQIYLSGISGRFLLFSSCVKFTFSNREI
jgi:hypothetical protein